MYFYILKNNEHENEQAELLEMCSNACFSFRDGKCIQGLIKKYTIIVKGYG
jgi:hypothetical protein